MSDLFFLAFKSDLMRKALEFEEKGEYFSSSYLYKFICLKQEEYDNCDNKELFLKDITASNLTFMYSIDDDIEKYVLSLENHQKIINQCINIFQNSNNINEFVSNYLKMQYSFDVVKSFKKKGLPIKVETNFPYDIDIKYNERILEIIKINFEAYKIEFNSVETLTYLDEKTNSLLNDIEFAQKSLLDTSNYNFCFISLKQISNKVQDYFSNKTI